jgi:hypothetical protein
MTPIFSVRIRYQVHRLSGSPGEGWQGSGADLAASRSLETATPPYRGDDSLVIPTPCAATGAVLTLDGAL